MSGFWQMSGLTSCPPSVTPSIFKPPMIYLARFLTSGWHRDRRSGRGFPNKFFMPFVMNQAAMTDKAMPSRPVCSSHSLRFQINDLGVPMGTVEPGTRTRQMTTMITMGTQMATITASQTGTVSLVVNGKLQRCQHPVQLHEREGGRRGSTYAMLRSSSEKGRLFGVIFPRT